MRILTIALCLAGSVGGAQKSPSRTNPTAESRARLPGPTLRVIDSLVVNSKVLKLEPPLAVFSGPKGKTIVYWQYSNVTVFDSLGRRLWAHEPQRQRREIADVTAVGFRGDEMWVTDEQYSQIAIFDAYGNVTKSLELPEWVRPTFSNRKSFPVFGSMRVFSIFPDGSMLVMPRRAHAIVGTSGYDEKSSYILKVSEEGIIQRTIAQFPNHRLTAVSTKGDSATFDNPVLRPVYRVSPDGMRTVVVYVDTRAPKTDTIMVRAFNDRGDTVYTQKIPYPASLMSDTQLDSIARQRWGGYDREYREARAKVLPRRMAAVFEMVMDYDKSVWITLRGSPLGKPVVGIDPTGRIIGTFQLPPKRAVKAADRGRLWLGDLPSIGHYLVRYTLGK